MKKLFFIILLAATVLVSCTEKPEEKPDNDTINVAEQIIGKWMTVEINGVTLNTNEKMVYTFESTTNGFISASLSDYSDDHPKWTNHTRSGITIDGKNITLTGDLDKTTSFVAELKVISLTDTEMKTDSKYTVYHNGTVQAVNSGTVVWSRVTRDYVNDIQGLWEGHVTNDEGSEYDDGETHRWEYFNDGSYIYYSLDGNKWTYDEDAMSQYFVDGTLLCTRWKNSGDGEVEHREWWEIASIADGVMNWTALRKRDDGTTFTATFTMTIVQE